MNPELIFTTENTEGEKNKISLRASHPLSPSALKFPLPLPRPLHTEPFSRRAAEARSNKKMNSSLRLCASARENSPLRAPHPRLNYRLAFHPKFQYVQFVLNELDSFPAKARRPCEVTGTKCPRPQTYP